MSSKKTKSNNAIVFKTASGVDKKVSSSIMGELDLGGRELTTIPSEIGNLKPVIELYLDNNQLTSIPPDRNLDKLEDLHLRINKLRSIPPQMGNLGELKFLDLS